MKQRAENHDAERGKTRALSRLHKLAAAAGLVALLVVVSAAGVLAATWDASCSAGDACVWREADFVVPLAATTTGDNDYSNDQYPNTTFTINNSASSIRNSFGQKDVVWYFNAGYSGTSWCVNAGTGYRFLNSHDNMYSPHLVAVGSTC